MGNNSNIKQGGTHNPNVDMRSGKINFSIPLLKMSTPAGANYDITLKYESALLPKLYETWNREENTGIIGAGWNLNIDDNIFSTGEGADVYHYLSFKGMLYLLNQTSFDGKSFVYNTMPVSNYVVRYISAEDCWLIYDEYGIKYYFGKDDTYNSEDGAYNYNTGTYVNASMEYERVRKIISDPDIDGTPNNINSDNTVCSSKELGVFWDDWVGPTYRTAGQTQRSIRWRLSNIEDAFSNVIAFSYIQHISNVSLPVDSYRYNICSYLYMIRVYLDSSEVERVSFDYQPKETGEYNVDFTLYERPNGIQYRFQKLLLSTITHSRLNVEDQTIRLITEMMDNWDNIGGLCKRQLTTIKFYNDSTSKFLTEPGYSFEYYGYNDGVSISREGFTTADKVYNARNGAMFGHLKKVVYPNGKAEEYTYLENNITSVPPEYIETIQDLKKQKEILSPYNYCIIMRLFNDNTITFTVYTWTVMGWISQELIRIVSSELFYENFSIDKDLDLAENTIGIINPGYKKFTLFKLSSLKIGSWDSIALPPINENFYTVSLNRLRLCLTTSSDAGYKIYTFITENESDYIMSPNPVIVNDKVGDSEILLTTCTENNFICVSLSYEYFNEAPNGFTGRTQQLNRTLAKAFVIFDDGTTSGVSDIGHIPYASISTDFTSPVPPLVSEPAKYSIYATVGANIVSGSKIERRGELLYVRIQQKGMIAAFARNIWTQDSFTVGTEVSEWGICLKYNRVNSTFARIGQPIIRDFEYANINFNRTDISDMKMHTNAVSSGNGITYTYYLNAPLMTTGQFSSPGTAEYVFDGGETTEKRDFFSQNYTCMFRDNFFETFYTMVSKPTDKQMIFKKTYRYFDQAKKIFLPVETGAIDTTVVSYNEQDYNAQTYLGYAGLALSILFLPLGLTSVFGVIVTALSFALMISSYVVQTLLNNSIRISLDPNITYYGNRFIADGATVWFRENGQEKLTSLGKGLRFSTEEGVRGDLITYNQQFGSIYNFVPFYTNANVAYYTTIVNGRLKKPRGLNPIAEGVSGLDYDPAFPLLMFAYKGNYKFIFERNELLGVDRVEINNENIFVDACFRFDDSGSSYIVIFTGSYYFIQDGTKFETIGKQKIKEGIRGSEFMHIDAALYEGWNTESGVQYFYIFNNNQYERVKYQKGIFSVTSKGNLDMLTFPVPFNKIDAAVYMNDDTYIMTRGSQYARINVKTSAIIEQGNIGDWLQETMTPDNTKLIFNYDALILTKVVEDSHQFVLKKYVEGSVQRIIKDYTVGTIKTYISSNSTEPDQTISYEYDTYGASYLEDGQSATYRQIDVVVDE